MKRVQIFRTKKDPPNTKRVCRPSRWGNPFKLSEYTLEQSLSKYRQWIKRTLEIAPDFLAPLNGYNLGCYCKEGAQCHGDILLEFLKKYKTLERFL